MALKCLAGNESCNGGYSSSREAKCPKCGLYFFRCQSCGSIVPGSKACICGQEELMLEQMRENMRKVPKPKFPNSERY